MFRQEHGGIFVGGISVIDALGRLSISRPAALSLQMGDIGTTLRLCVPRSGFSPLLEEALEGRMFVDEGLAMNLSEKLRALGQYAQAAPGSDDERQVYFEYGMNTADDLRDACCDILMHLIGEAIVPRVAQALARWHMPVIAGPVPPTYRIRFRPLRQYQEGARKVFSWNLAPNLRWVFT